jgi:hypothetical protein
MRNLFYAILLFFIIPAAGFAQKYPLSHADESYNCYRIGSTEAVLWRIQNGINSRNIASFEDLFGSSITLQIEDSVYRNIPSLTALDLIHKYFKNRHVSDFLFTTDEQTYASGKMNYTYRGKKESTYVSLYFIGNDFDLTITRINFTNAILSF